MRELLITYNTEIVIFNGKKRDDYEPKYTICQQNSTCIHLLHNITTIM